MKLFKKVLTGVAVAAALATSAHAINVGGVVWDPSSPLDFGGITATIEQSIDATTGELSGFAVITSINGTGAATFCPGCEVTAHYSGYMPIGGSSAIPTPADPAGSQIFYNGGSIQVYRDYAMDAPAFNALGLTLANTTGGALWLDLVGHPTGLNGMTLTGTNNFSGLGILQGKGLWDVVGGLASGNLNTNLMADGSDLSFSNTFTSFPTNSVLFATGGGTFNGSSVPEPESLALVGLGLLGLAASRRRKSV